MFLDWSNFRTSQSCWLTSSKKCFGRCYRKNRHKSKNELYHVIPLLKSFVLRHATRENIDFWVCVKVPLLVKHGPWHGLPSENLEQALKYSLVAGEFQWWVPRSILVILRLCLSLKQFLQNENPICNFR